MRKGQVMLNSKIVLVMLVISSFISGFLLNNIIRTIYELKQQADGSKIWQEKK